MSSVKEKIDLTKQEALVLKILRQKRSFSKLKDVAETAELSRFRACDVLKSLVGKGVVEKGERGYYKAAK